MGEKGVMAVVDDVGEGMQCGEHPYRTNPGGICAFCLQEKLGKLVSSSNPSPSFFPLPATLPHSSSSNSSSPSFRSDFGGGGGAAAAAGVAGRNKIPFLSAVGQKKKSNISSSNGNVSNGNGNGVFVLKRSKSVVPRPNGGIGIGSIVEDSPRKKSFWSFFYLSTTNSSVSASTTNKRRSTDVHPKTHQQQQQQEETTADEESVNKVREQETSEGSQRKVARSRSVGCGSRSFSGDFLERISTGFGDCTLRRVESQRETNKNGNGAKMVIGHQIKERVKCGGIFGMITSSYWLSAADVDDFGSTSSRMTSSARAGGRNRSWGWTFSSPMRAFRPVSTSKSFGLANSGSKSKIGNVNLSSLAVGS